MDKAYVGSCRVGYTRVDVFRPDWDNIILSQLKKVDASKMWTKILAQFKKQAV